MEYWRRLLSSIPCSWSPTPPPRVRERGSTVAGLTGGAVASCLLPFALLRYLVSPSGVARGAVLGALVATCVDVPVLVTRWRRGPVLLVPFRQARGVVRGGR